MAETANNFDTLPLTTVTKNVGKCPACRGYLWAEVDLATHITPPEFTYNGELTVHACATAVGMRLHHVCAKETA